MSARQTNTDRHRQTDTQTHRHTDTSAVCVHASGRSAAGALRGCAGAEAAPGLVWVCVCARARVATGSGGEREAARGCRGWPGCLASNALGPPAAGSAGADGRASGLGAQAVAADSDAIASGFCWLPKRFRGGWPAALGPPARPTLLAGAAEGLGPAAAVRNSASLSARSRLCWSRERLRASRAFLTYLGQHRRRPGETLAAGTSSGNTHGNEETETHGGGGVGVWGCWRCGLLVGHFLSHAGLH
jgi:hypothetical protein